MIKFSLNEIARAVRAKKCDFPQIYVDKICSDTRKITQGSLFIAIKGENFDGHDFIDKAFELGANAVISHKEIDTDKPVILVEDTRKALLSLARHNRLNIDALIVGVTGSVGKTSTKDMIACVLGAKYNTYKTKGNLNNDIGLPHSLLELDQSFNAAVIEMGMSNFGEIEVLSQATCPNIGVITNIGVSHIENLGSRDGILKAKMEIKSGLGCASPLVLNGDDDKLITVKGTVENPVMYYGIDNKDCAVYGKNIVQNGDQTEFDIVYEEKQYHAKIPTIGKHNVMNALCAFGVARLAGIDTDKIISAFMDYKPSGMRQNIVKHNGYTVIEDCYNASPDSMKASLSVLHDINCDGKRIAVLGDMLELGEYSEKAHENVGKVVVESGADVLFCYGKQAKYIAKGAQESNVQIKCFEDINELVDELYKTVSKGDVVVFKASHGMHLEKAIEGLYSR